MTPNDIQEVLQGYLATQWTHCFSLEAMQHIRPKGKHKIAQHRPGIEQVSFSTPNYLDQKVVFSSSHAFANPDFFFPQTAFFLLKKPVIAVIVFYFDLNEDLLHGRKTKINKFQEKNLVDSEKHFCFLIFCKHYISMTSYPFNFMRYFLNYISNRKFGRTLEDL